MSQSATSVGTVDEFPEGKANKVEVKGIPILIFNINGEYYGIHNTCPHKNYPMERIGEELHVGEEFREGSEQTYGDIDEENLCISCPWHDLEWDLETGHNPVLNRSISTFDVEERDGEIFVQI